MTARRFDPEEVARVYLEALEAGLPLINTVREVMDVDFNQARHMIRTVRDDGFIGLKPHLPARAVIHRGTKRVRGFLVCEHCLHAWPCRDAYPYGEPAYRGSESEER